MEGWGKREVVLKKLGERPPGKSNKPEEEARCREVVSLMYKKCDKTCCRTLILEGRRKGAEWATGKQKGWREESVGWSERREDRVIKENIIRTQKQNAMQEDLRK